MYNFNLRCKSSDLRGRITILMFLQMVLNSIFLAAKTRVCLALCNQVSTWPGTQATKLLTSTSFCLYYSGCFLYSQWGKECIHCLWGIDPYGCNLVITLSLSYFVLSATIVFMYKFLRCRPSFWFLSLAACCWLMTSVQSQILPLSVAFGVLFHFPFSLPTTESQIICSCSVFREGEKRWMSHGPEVFWSLLQADLVPEHVYMYLFTCFRDQDLISPGQTGTVICEDCCCCCFCWATMKLVYWLQR